MSLALVRISLVDNLKECESNLKDAQDRIDALRFDPAPVQNLQEATQKLVEDLEILTEDIEQAITQDLVKAPVEGEAHARHNRAGASADTQND